MPAVSTIFFNGKLISRPGSYSQVDASGLEQVGLGASGIVAILGTAEGGRPANTMTQALDFTVLTTPQQVRNTFRSGDLKEACAMAFEPGNDPNIPGGAQTVIAMKVNPATQSSATFSNANGTVMTVTSNDYGAFTSQVNVSIANGSVVSGSKLLTDVLESTTEAQDNIGGLPMFTLEYTQPGGDGGWTAMNAQVLNSGVRANGTRAALGLSTQVSSTTMGGDTVVQVVATATDAGKIITIYGVNGTTPTRENITLINGTANGTLTHTAVYGSALSAAAGAGITVQHATGPTTLHTYSAAQSERGIYQVSQMYVGNTTLDFVASGSSTAPIVVWGLNASGVGASEIVTLNGTTNVPTVGSYSQINVLVMGGVSNTLTITTTGPAVQTSNLVQKTMQRVADYFNARSGAGPTGFVLTQSTGNTQFNPALLDLTQGAGQNIFNPAVGSFNADLNAIISAFNTGSQIVNATRIAFAPQINNVTITAAIATYTVTINGTAITYTSGLGTAADIQAGLIAAINNTPAVNTLVAASAGASTTILVVTSQVPASFTISVGANLVLSSVQLTAGAGGPPSNTTQAVYLTGGVEGTTTFSNYQNALNLLQLTRVNSIVVLTGDPATQQALIAHCQFMAGIGRSERDGFVGLSALDGQGNSIPTQLPTLNSIVTQVANLNTRHVRAFAQSIDRFDTTGTLTTFMPWFQGVIAAGMQAGAPVGTSLTRKFAKIIAIHMDSSWNPAQNAEQLIQSGLCFMEDVGTGRRFVRNITTYLQTTNLAFTEGSVNQAVNFAVFNFRTNMEIIVGQRGFLGTINAAKGVAINTLGLLVDQGIIVQYRALTLQLVADVLQVSVEIAPVIPINFVESTIHLVTVRTIAA